MATYKVQPLDENNKLPKAVLPQLNPADVGADPAGAAQAALNDASASLAVHTADQTAVHGIADTAQLETLAGAQAKAATAQANAVNAAATDATGKITAHSNASDPHGDRAAAAAALAAHEGDTTAIHGIANTALLETTNGAQTKANTAQSNAVAAATAAAATDAASKITTHTNATDPHGDRAFSVQRANHTGTQPVSTVNGLQSILDGKVETNDPRLTPAGVVSAHAGTHGAGQSDAVTLSQAQVAGLVAALAAKADLSGGFVPSSQLPPFLINNVTAVASQAAMLALPGPRGAIAARTDFNPVQLYILTSDSPSTLNDWKPIGLAGAVISVNGQTGAVVLSAADVGAVPTSRTITTTGALTGGGALSGNITLTVPNATAAVLGALQLAGDLTGSATAPTIAAGVVSTAKLADGATTTVKLSDASVTTVKIVDGAVTAAKIVSVPASKVTGLGTAATLNVGVTGGVASFDDTRFAAGAGGGLVASNNLSDLPSPATARTNLGLGTAATKDTGVTSSTVAAGDAPAAAQAAAIAASVPRGAQVIDVKLQYGVAANGSTDDTAAWQAATAAATAGSVLYLSSGNSIIKAPIVLKTGVKLLGSKATWYGTQVTHGSSITIGSGFVGLAAVIVNDGTVGSGFSQLVNDVHVHSITLYGADLTAAGGAPIHGILMQGNVQDFYGADVMVTHFTGTGIYGLTKVVNSVNYKVISFRFERVVAFFCGQSGWDIETTDSWLSGCMGFNAGADGFKIRHFNNSRMINCTAEHNSGRGINLIDNPGSRGSWMFTACSTDQNNLDGFYVGVINGWGTIQINACSFRRDGNNNNTGGGNYAGIQINGTKVQVVISGTGVTPYLGDGGTAYGPQAGIRIRNATYVSFESGIVHGFTTAIDWDGAGILRRGVAVATGTGPSATPTWDYSNPIDVSAIKLAGTDLATSLVTTPATTKTANHTLTLADAGTTVEVNTASAATITVPLASAVNFPLGTRIEILQYGAGQVTVTPVSGATVLTASSLSTRVQYSRIFLRKRATNEWVLSGDLAATTGGGGGGTDPGTDPGTPVVGTPTTTSYATSTEIFPSPERGFFQYTETHYDSGRGSSLGFVPLVASTLSSTRTSLGRSIVFRYYVMENMLALDTIPQDWLNKLAADCVAVRAAGCKMVPRFVYNNSGDGTGREGVPTTAITEPAPARLLGHINQIAAVVNANKDVIHAVQQGFVGMWGEQYYSGTVGGGTQYGDQGSTNSTQKQNRIDVMTRLLQQLDPSIYVQLRYVGLIRWASTAGLNMERIGFHNDAVGSLFGDFGTYSTYNDQSEADARSYLTAFMSQSLGRPHGGESASLNAPSTEYPAMRAQFSGQRWSYLNPEYEPSVLASWSQANRDEVSRLMGYRLRLISSTMPETATPGASMSVSFQIANDGWGRVLGTQARPVRVVFVNGTTVVARTLTYDIRSLAPGATATVTETIVAPTAGSWSVHLWMPDLTTALQDLPAYSIQLANTGVWNATTGRNGLNRTLTVATSTGGGGGGGGTDPGTGTGTPVTVNFTASQALFGRPESGFFTYTQVKASEGGTLDAAAIQGARISDQRTLVFRYYVLDSFLNTDTISSTFLNALAADLQACKTAGVKLIPRFCYNISGDYAAVTEPAPARIFTHIDQLAAIINAPAAAGIVHALEAGFVGMWGEQYYTNTVGGGSQYGAVGTAQNPGLVDGVSDGSGSGPQKTNRINVLTKIVNTFNSSIPILVRYVGIMHWAEQAGLPMSRIGFHNDAIGAPDGDYGTYSTYNTGESESAARAYLISKIPGKPHGHESAVVNAPSTLYPAMSAQFAAQQWSFLNPIFQFDVLSSWTQDNRDEVNRRLGCRLRLTTATLPTAVSAGATVAVSLTLVNDGWGKMTVARPLQIRFVNGGTTVTRTLAFDVRTIAPGATATVSESVVAPGAGSWTMHLALPDPTAQLAGIPAYAVQLANTGLWDANTGRNSLNNTVTVTAAGFTTGTSAPPSSGTAVTVDFRTTTYALDKWSIGATISTYGTPQQSNINASASWRSALGALGPLAWRIPIRYAAGNPGSSAGGANTAGDAVTYINNIRSIGGTPYIAIGGNNSDNVFTNSDVTGLVNFFNGNGGAAAGGKIERWILGNEPENAGTASIDAYIAALPGWVSAAKAADPTVLVSAPAAAYWDTATIQRAINASSQIDILSYHAYDGANTDGTGFPQTAQYRQHILDLRTMKAGLKYGLEETNWKAFYQNLGDFYTWRNTCFLASVIGQTLSAGGHAYQYSDSNGALGLMNDGAGNDNQPGSILTRFPAYWALGMWTGMNGTFRRYGGNMVTTTWTAQPTVNNVAMLDCFPCDNGKIMLINKDATTASTITIGLGGVTDGTYVTWATDPNAPTATPTQTGNGTFTGSKLTITVPAKTVVSLELN